MEQAMAFGTQADLSWESSFRYRMRDPRMMKDPNFVAEFYAAIDARNRARAEEAQRLRKLQEEAGTE